MADVFISYSRKDQAAVGRLAAALAEQGLDVFWDRDIGAGADFARTIEREIDAARQVFVVWSANATDSQWVRDEAELAQSQGKLIPISLDGTLGPLGFRQLQTLDMASWFAGRNSASLGELLSRIGQQTAPRPPLQAAPPQANLKSSRGWVLGAALALILAVGWQWWRASANLTDEPVPATRSDRVGLAVIPFRSLSTDGSDELFADGLSEELLHRLSAVRGLVVPGRSSVFRFKNANDEPQVMGRQLNVDYLVEGTVRRSGDALRITASLVEASTGFSRWSQTFDRDLADLFSIQDDIARAVVSALLGAISYDEVAKASYKSVSPEAHASYLEGRALWRSRDNSALGRFDDALALDPEHALAHAYKAIVAAYLEQAPSPASSQALARATAALPEHPDVLFAQAWVAEMTRAEDQTNVARRYAQALRANPRHIEALYASYRMTNDSALLESALRIDPAHLPVRSALALRYYSDGDRAAAASFLLQTYNTYQELSPAVLAETAKDFGDFETYTKLLFTDPSRSLADYWSRSMFSMTLAEMGALPEAQFLLDAGTDSLSLTNSAMLRRDWGAYQTALMGADVPPVFRPFAQAMGFYVRGRFEDALKELRARWPEVFAEPPELRSGRLGSDGDWVALLGSELLARSGRSSEAQALAGAMVSWMPPAREDGGNWRVSFQRALVYAKLNQNNEAVEAFLRAVDQGFRYPLTYGCEACLWPAIDWPKGFLQPILSEPRVQQALKDIRSGNAEALEELQRRYGVLDHVRAMMAEA